MGHFFIRENLIDMTYRLEQRKLALVLPATVRHICGDLKWKREEIFQVPIEVNNESIASLLRMHQVAKKYFNFDKY